MSLPSLKSNLLKVNNNKRKRHTQTPTHRVTSTLRMRTALSPRQWMPWTAVSALLGLISMAYLSGSSTLPLTAKAGTKHRFERQLHTTHMGSGGWEPHGSAPTACAGKVDQPLLPISVPVKWHMPWENCHAVSSHKLPHVLCGAGN